MRTRYLIFGVIFLLLFGFSGSVVLAGDDESPESLLFSLQIVLPMDLVDIPQSLTQEGFPLYGDPNAPVQVIQISSFTCPPCATFTIETFPLLLNRIRAGEISYVFVPAWIFGEVGDGFSATIGSFCAAQQFGFYSYSKVLFHAQVFYGVDAFTFERLLSYAEFVGLDMTLWESCYIDPTIVDLLDAAVTYTTNIPDFFGTPAILVNVVLLAERDIDSINNAIDSAIGNAT